MTEPTLSPTATPTANDNPLSERDMQDTTVSAPDPVVQESMFFTLLNRDVRMSIYDFLYEWLPPLPYKKRWSAEDDCRGMVLACKQANLELSEAAARQMKVFYDQFCKDFAEERGHPIKLYGSIPLHQGWQALRSVTFVLDIGFFAETVETIAKIPDDHSKNWLSEEEWQKLGLDGGTGWTRTITQWRTLLSHPFDKVTLLITDASHSNDTTDTQMQNYRQTVVILRDSLASMLETLGNDWLRFQQYLDFDVLCEEEFPLKRHFNKYGEYDNTPKRAWYKSAELFRFARVQHERLGDKTERKIVEREAMSSNSGNKRRIQTKQICFAWNFLSSTAPAPKKLLGKKHTYTADHAEALRKTDQLRKLKYENAWPHRYEVAAAEGLIGEMGIRHPKRWILASEEYDEYYGMMGRLTEVEDVESKGIGMSLVKMRKPRVKKAEAEVEDGE